jgi:hypothetical protein
MRANASVAYLLLPNDATRPEKSSQITSAFSKTWFCPESCRNRDKNPRGTEFVEWLEF